MPDGKGCGESGAASYFEHFADIGGRYMSGSNVDKPGHTCQLRCGITVVCHLGFMEAFGNMCFIGEASPQQCSEVGKMWTFDFDDIHSLVLPGCMLVGGWDYEISA